ncbi:hypothetical protein [Chromobacterium paludis]|uniref:Uncharacterized protein n=1 Tax=Chromobacterium paludis TaxID=2605945 RepID=A0A5C1DFJ1_9NEIS|nr:hypothetical protein [Chromobacterium paludis]QEL55501.1 hypothetical protein FYK34_07945 [Chromobacterium paludis]
MKIDVQLSELALANAELVATGQQIDRALRRAVRVTATTIRREMVVEPIMARTGLRRKSVNQRLALKFDKPGKDGGTANILSGPHVARIVPSAKGIRVTEFRRYEVQAITRTRARILIPWVDGGKKVVAGFVNPSGSKLKPMRTRSRNKPLPYPRTALAPSVASMVKAMYDSQFVADAGARLEAQFELEIAKEIDK